MDYRYCHGWHLPGGATWMGLTGAWVHIFDCCIAAGKVLVPDYIRVPGKVIWRHLGIFYCYAANLHKAVFAALDNQWLCLGHIFGHHCLACLLHLPACGIIPFLSPNFGNTAFVCLAVKQNYLFLLKLNFKFWLSIKYLLPKKENLGPR